MSFQIDRGEEATYRGGEESSVGSVRGKNEAETS